MKILVVSDIHGSYYYGKKIIKLIEKEEAEKVFLLGDVLYHGPRNPLPKGHNAKKLYELLNQYSDKFIAVRGNCDGEIDQMMLEFKLEESVDMKINDKNVHLEHGHHLDFEHVKGDIIFSGHTHVHGIKQVGEQIFVNPGSTSLPKNNQKPSYATFDEYRIQIKTFKGKVLEEIALK